MTDNVLTPKFRGAWVNLFRASKNKDASPEAKAKFSIRAVFEPGTDLGILKREAETALAEKFGPDKAKWPKNLRSPFRRNDELDNPIVGVADEAVVMTFSANEDRRPGIVDARLNDIIDESEVYAGAYYRAQVRAFYYENKGNKGVSFGLQNVQKLADGEPMGGRMSAAKAFDAVETGDSAASVFD